MFITFREVIFERDYIALQKIPTFTCNTMMEIFSKSVIFAWNHEHFGRMNYAKDKYFKPYFFPVNYSTLYKIEKSSVFASSI